MEFIFEDEVEDLLSGFSDEQKVNIINYVVNQFVFFCFFLIFLIIIMINFFVVEKKDLKKDQFCVIIEGIVVVGIICRQGKDVVGKFLESEYYYIFEKDSDEYCCLVVMDGFWKFSLRNCCKQYKVSFFKLYCLVC